MKYLTKDWYQTCQRSDIGFGYKVSVKAESFDEDYFRYLYTKKEKARLKLEEEICLLEFEPMDQEAIDEWLDNWLDEPEMREKMLIKLLADEEADRLSYLNQPPFDPKKEKRIFRKNFKKSIVYYQEILPKEILSMIADIRVFALGYFSKSVKAALKEYNQVNRKAIKAIDKAYEKAYRQFLKHNPNIMHENLHDCIVISTIKQKKDLVMTLNNSFGFTSVNKVIFRNFTIVKQDKRLNGSRWVYDEIYKTQNGYELHVLMYNNEPIDFIVEVSDIDFFYDDQE